MNESNPFTGSGDALPRQPLRHSAERALARACLRLPPLRHWGRRLLAKSLIHSVEWHERNGARAPRPAPSFDGNAESAWD